MRRKIRWWHSMSHHHPWRILFVMIAPRWMRIISFTIWFFDGWQRSLMCIGTISQSLIGRCPFSVSARQRLTCLPLPIFCSAPLLLWLRRHLPCTIIVTLDELRMKISWRGVTDIVQNEVPTVHASGEGRVMYFLHEFGQNDLLKLLLIVNGKSIALRQPRYYVVISLIINDLHKLELARSICRSSRRPALQKVVIDQMKRNESVRRLVSYWLSNYEYDIKDR